MDLTQKRIKTGDRVDSADPSEQQLNLSLIRFTLGIPGLDESYLSRWIGYGFGSLLVLNHFVSSNLTTVTPAQLIDECSHQMVLELNLVHRMCASNFLILVVAIQNDESSKSSDEDDYTMVVKELKKFFKRRGKFVSQPRDEKKSYNNKKASNEKKRYRCGDPNHFIGDCPKPPKKEGKSKALVGGA
ncbi:hypothetical protein L1987_05709 [Smallanthus sonchifolius]|uniref:Uncharacterized protein n=1 Tax=Smallanthus sonchifolius TaxID=185202 RepID=A0ACB9JW87_9ASTR|nr:hypothetical protein L1987_05709 [Smallanthus sonchifolius]